MTVTLLLPCAEDRKKIGRKIGRTNYTQRAYKEPRGFSFLMRVFLLYCISLILRPVPARRRLRARFQLNCSANVTGRDRFVGK